MTDPHQRPTRVRYIVLLGLCLAAGLAYLNRLALGSAKTTISAELGISENAMSWALSAFFFTYALFQIPTGILVDRWGPRRSLFLFGMLGALTVAMSAGTLILGSVAGLAILCSSRALMGMAQAGLFPAATRCMANWFPLSQRAFAAGTLQACMSIGAMLGAPILGELLVTVAWPWVFVIIAVPGVLWSVWFYSWFRDRPIDHSSVNAEERALIAQNAEASTLAPSTGKTPWLRLASHPKVYWLCLSQFFRAGANVFWMTLCPSFLQVYYHLDPKVSGWLMLFPFLGVVLGSFLGGLLVDAVLRRTGSKRWSRPGVAISTAAIGVGIFVLAYFLPLSVYPAVALLFLAALFSSGGNSCSYTVSIDIGGRYMAVVFGAMNMIGNFGAALFSPVAVPWKATFGEPAILLLMALLYLVSTLCWVFVNPDGTIEEQTETTENH